MTAILIVVITPLVLAGILYAVYRETEIDFPCRSAEYRRTVGRRDRSRAKAQKVSENGNS
jgi:hypothetical protein